MTVLCNPGLLLLACTSLLCNSFCENKRFEIENRIYIVKNKQVHYDESKTSLLRLQFDMVDQKLDKLANVQMCPTTGKIQVNGSGRITEIKKSVAEVVTTGFIEVELGKLFRKDKI